MPQQKRLRISGALLVAPTDPLLTTAQVAEELGLDIRKVYQLLRGGELAHINLGFKTKRIRRSALNQYLADREVGPCS